MRLPFFILLCLPPVLSSVIPKDCKKTQYKWPHNSYELCCEKCPAGEFVAKRSPTTCYRTCEPCGPGKYTTSYNAAMTCDFCDSCNKPNMEVKTECNATHNTVCTCKAGYKCGDQDCKECVAIPGTIIPTVPPSTTVARPEVTTTQRAPKAIADTAWFLVIIALLCTGIALVVVTKIKPFLVWIRFTHGYFLAEKPATQPQCDEEVSKPVQEVCGKCDQPMC
ncbi:tumor necrosis factor receptor superfamily member 23 [Oreochromis aureus]|uniref:tumor necrosis factor receptor superfamily member 23 n=1 Tax=Oreochromis aureus TaxID=47969 RepID=UPI0012BB9AA6|nr:tumor necrosis factor receptor superfamily member 23 [Oreochromis aureus]XP_039476155.1 tumor necrosis factor receptor superfamily member 23 [Oreochromis aureus]XP_039476156.1 tumor necrosis factor receptor superfamily member 23 [Oreochromis aureus]XP_039476157.1 tumor necrosis factor receptor superfamily member 23 [Oreochromis aureus]